MYTNIITRSLNKIKRVNYLTKFNADDMIIKSVYEWRVYAGKNFTGRR